MMRILLIAAMMAVALPGSAGATVRSGIEAWQKGDPVKAVVIWRGLADKGDADAAFNLGQAYRLGRGVKADSGEAKKWFLAAARAGHLDAQVSLGLLLFDTGDRAGALIWLQRAAERGEPRALLVTGTAIFNGDVLKRDPVLGYAYVSRAAAQGLAAAKATLADMDKVMLLEDRKRGVALALAAATAKPKPSKPSLVAPVKKTLTPAVISTNGAWRIQLGAFGTGAAAQALFARLAPRLGVAQPFFVPIGGVTRLQAGPFASRAEAAAACARLKPQPCFAVPAK